MYCRYIYEGYLYSSTVDYTASTQQGRLYTWSLLSLGYVLPNILIILSHLTILGLYRFNNFEDWVDREGGQSGNHMVSRQRLNVERRLWRGSLLLLTVWLVSWSPYAGVFLAFVTGNSHLVTQHSDMIPGID